MSPPRHFFGWHWLCACLQLAAKGAGLPLCPAAGWGELLPPPPRAWRGAGADPPLRSTPHRSETSTQHCSVWSESLKAAVVLIFLGWTVMRPLIVGSHAISCITRRIKRHSANSSCTLRSCCLHVYLKGLAVKPVKSTSDGK